MSDSIALAREVLKEEAAALISAAERLDNSFNEAVNALKNISGRVVCTGLGKSGHIARKIAATMASTGSPAFFLHPSEALHGDLGMMSEGDALLAIAYGGETAEVLEVARYANRIGLPIIAMTGNRSSSLARVASFVINAAVTKEVCPHNLAPTTSSTLTLALGDALAMALMDAKGFKPENFAELHPSGSLGKKLKRVKELMRSDLTRIGRTENFPRILQAMQERNYGLIGVFEDASTKAIAGVITDGDLRRAVERHQEGVFQLTAADIMTSSPKSIDSSALAIEAVRIMEKHKNTVLLVREQGVSDLANVVGVLRMHDLVEAKLI